MNGLLYTSLNVTECITPSLGAITFTLRVPSVKSLTSPLELVTGASKVSTDVKAPLVDQRLLIVEEPTVREAFISMGAVVAGTPSIS